MQFDRAHQAIPKYLFLFYGIISLLSLLWFGINQTLAFLYDFINFFCAMSLGIIPLHMLAKRSVVLVLSLIVWIWIVLNIVNLKNAYEKEIFHNPECDISCLIHEPGTAISVIIILAILVYLYSPISNQFKKSNA